MFTEDHYSRRYYQSPHTRPNKEGIRPEGPKLQDIDKVFILLIDLERIYFSPLYQALTFFVNVVQLILSGTSQHCQGFLQVYIYHRADILLV